MLRLLLLGRRSLPSPLFTRNLMRMRIAKKRNKSLLRDHYSFKLSANCSLFLYFYKARIRSEFLLIYKKDFKLLHMPINLCWDPQVEFPNMSLRSMILVCYFNDWINGSGWKDHKYIRRYIHPPQYYPYCTDQQGDCSSLFTPLALTGNSCAVLISWPTT